MSIAGIAKEVTTISASAWFFGDELTPLNVTGVSITICGEQSQQPAAPSCNTDPRNSGIALYTYHKYRKHMEAKVPLDAHGNPITDEEDGDLGGVPLQEGVAEERQPLAASVDLELNLGSAYEEHRVGFRTTSEASRTDYRWPSLGAAACRRLRDPV